MSFVYLLQPWWWSFSSWTWYGTTKTMVAGYWYATICKHGQCVLDRFLIVSQLNSFGLTSRFSSKRLDRINKEINDAERQLQRGRWTLRKRMQAGITLAFCIANAHTQWISRLSDVESAYDYNGRRGDKESNVILIPCEDVVQIACRCHNVSTFFWSHHYCEQRSSLRGFETFFNSSDV